MSNNISKFPCRPNSFYTMAVYMEACIESQFLGICNFSSCVFNPVNWFLCAKGLKSTTRSYLGI